MSDTIASKLETQSDVNQDQRKKRVREAVNNGLPGQVFVLPKYIAREYASKIRRTAEPGSMAFWTEGASRQVLRNRITTVVVWPYGTSSQVQQLAGLNSKYHSSTYTTHEDVELIAISLALELGH